MGGSGGNFDPPRIRSEIRELEGRVEDAEYEAEVAHVLSNVLATANDRDTDAIQKHLNVIQQAIENDVEGFVDLLFGGSVSKNTYVAGVSDVDALVVLNDSALRALTPLEARDYLIARLRERLPGTSVEPDGFAVAVRYSDGLVELVPARRHGDDYLLPGRDFQTWTRVRPRAFTDALTTTNRTQNGKVVPTIKLAKVALSDLPEARRPNDYHLESLAVEIFTGYQGPKRPKEMLTHFFSEAAKRVLQPIVDRTGQSRHVDDNLGAARSLERQILSDGLGRISRRLQNADGAHAVDQWKRVFGAE
ncbi:MAG TPA: CBASS oligonucleotide cyclase [Kofleriaceae bacterium]|nr:CBASS oligonucleotide cyclase [Kofleriaceae bacterium]